jgi:Leucine-rich repeat (LRR) protein
LTGNSIDVTHLPEGLTKADLAQNPLGSSSNRLLGALGKLTKLKELSLHACQLSDSALPSSSAKPPFQKLESLDLGDNEDVTDARIRLFLNGRTISFGVETIDETGSLVKVISGKKIVKEAWEIEAERRGRGGRSITPASAMRSNTKSPSSPPAGPVVKEQWEIDAEQGLTTAAGRLRAKMAGQGKALLSSTPENEATTSSSSTADVTPPSAPQVASLTKYYTASHASLSLPSSLPPSKKGLLHSRSVSLSHSVNGPPLTDPAVPRQTLPLSIILAQQPWGATLRVLELSNRRADVCFLLGSQGLKGGLGRLEELKMDGCNLGDEVRCVVEKDGGGKEEMKSRLLDTLKELFPSLTVLDLSYNVITSLSGIEEMFFPPSSPGQGLKALRVRGNKISDIRPLEAIAERFERAGGAGVGVEGWKGEEIDLRENEVGKLLPILGLLPLDIFLVEGNL